MTAPANTSPDLVLVAETTAAGEALLAALLAKAPPACVIVAPEGGLPRLCPDDAEPPPAPRALDLDRARNLVATAQAADVAVLLATDPAAAIETAADGLHLDASDDVADRFEAMRRILGPRATIGVLSDLSRHTAMVLGEAGADYIGFDLRPGTAPGGLDMIAWWAEIFEVPVVALIAPEIDTARAALAAGADFLAVCPPAGADVAATLAALDEIGALLDTPT